MRRVLMSLTVLATTLSAGCADPNPTTPNPSDAAYAGLGTTVDASANPLDIAVIGDVPYGPIATEHYPELIAGINGDPKVRRVVHVGDIKAGAAECTDEWYAFIRSSFDDFKDPLVYTPGDNEWTDCHRPNNGSYNPLERLDRIREVFYEEPGVTMGRRSMRVETQPGFPENQHWIESRVVFVTAHAVGSNNGLGTWTGESGPTPEQLAAFSARDAANRAWIEHAFDLAEEMGAAGVAVFIQADMWSNGIVAGSASHTGHQAFVETLAGRAYDFGKPVVLVVGDTHRYRVLQPLVGDATYGIGFDVPNLTQVTIEQTIRDADIVWLRLHVDPRTPEVFSWEEVR